MKFSKEQEISAIDLYKVYFDSYIGGDIEAITLMLNEDYTQIGSAESEVFFNKEEALHFLRKTIHQVAGKATIRNRLIKCEWLQDYLMVIDLFDMYVLAEKEWVFYSKFRASTLMEYKEQQWKFVHQHSSVPDVRTNEGDNIAIERISAENLQLRDAIKRRTIELEQKNRELEIETSLEKIRSAALSMREPEDMLSVCRIIAQQLQSLGIEEIRNVQTVIINETQGMYINYQYFVPYNQTVTELIDYRLNETVQSFVTQMLTAADAFFSKTFEGQELVDWVKYRKDTNQLPDPKLESTSSAHYYFYSIGIGALGVSTYNALNEESLNVFKRFRNVFDLAYRRYDDIKTAERQTKEAKIEVALERIRAKALAMQKSHDILEVADVMREQMRNLGQPELESCLIHLYKEEIEEIESWYAYRPPEQSSGEIITGTSHVSADACEWTREVMDKYRSDESEYTIVSTGSKIQGWYKTLEKIAPDVVDYDEQGQLIIPEILYYHFSKFSGGALLMIANTEASAETCEMLRRAAVVFELAYTRFLDLQKAEDQAREATIETALERVRSRTMAMQNSTELPEAANLLFHQMQNLGMPTWSAGYCIWNDSKQAVTLWMSSEGVIQPPFVLPLTEDPSLIHMRDAYNRRESFHVEAVGGRELEIHYSYMRTQPVVGSVLDSIIEAGFPLPTFQIFHCAYFSQGFLLFITYESVPKSWDIFKRFANVFDQTYTRFQDLQKAEAQAREATIEIALEKVRSKTMAMHNSRDVGETVFLMFEELKQLGIKTFRCGISIMHPSENMEVWTATQDAIGKPVLIIGWLDMNLHPMLQGAVRKWKEKHEMYSYELFGEDHHRYFTAINNHPDYPVSYDISTLPAHIFHNEFYFAEGTLFSFSMEQLPDEHKKIFKRFSGVFGQTYRRYLDLKNAEAQAKESQIETALERVRSRTLAMQKSNELSATVSVLFQQLITMGIEPNRLYVAIIKDETSEAEFWITDEEGNKISSAYIANLLDNLSLKKMYDGWRAKQSSLFIEMEGKELQEYFEHLMRLNVSFKGALTQKRRLQYIAYFSKGFIGLATPDEQQNETIQLLTRFAGVFNLTFIRFNDLKIAEAHAEQAELDLIKLKEEKKRTEDAMAELQVTQKQLIQAEKMASLGQLTAGIAHEIQNPLNFVNNFSEISEEMIVEAEALLAGHGVSGSRQEEKNSPLVAELLADVKQNLQKIAHHGKRADSIVKGMLEHSRTSSGQKQPTDINALINEYLKLAFYGYRTKEKTFEAKLITDFDPTPGMINIAPQEIGRVLLNLFNNAFFAVAEKSRMVKGQNYEPSVYITTKKSADKLLITIGDNGPGIPENIIDKIFQPFFTTKPTGQGTGLGLSLAYDIITKGHDGQLSVNSWNEGVEFVISIPLS